MEEGVLGPQRVLPGVLAARWGQEENFSLEFLELIIPLLLPFCAFLC